MAEEEIKTRRQSPQHAELEHIELLKEVAKRRGPLLNLLRACEGQGVQFADWTGFRTSEDNAAALDSTGSSWWLLVRIGFTNVSLTTGEERTSGRTLIAIMRTRWQTGHSRKQRPVSLSYRSR